MHGVCLTQMTVFHLSIHPSLPPSLPSSEHASWCNIWTVGGSGVGLPAHHCWLHILLPALLCVWKATRGSFLPGEGGPAAAEGRRLDPVVNKNNSVQPCG